MSLVTLLNRIAQKHNLSKILCTAAALVMLTGCSEREIRRHRCDDHYGDDSRHNDATTYTSKKRASTASQNPALETKYVLGVSSERAQEIVVYYNNKFAQENKSQIEWGNLITTLSTAKNIVFEEYLAHQKNWFDDVAARQKLKPLFETITSGYEKLSKNIENGKLNCANSHLLDFARTYKNLARIEYHEKRFGEAMRLFENADNLYSKVLHDLATNNVQPVPSDVKVHTACVYHAARCAKMLGNPGEQKKYLTKAYTLSQHRSYNGHLKPSISNELAALK